MIQAINELPMNGRDIFVLYLQIITDNLVEDPYRKLIQNTIIKLHVIDSIDNTTISKGLSLIGSNKRKYFSNFYRICNKIYDPKPNNCNFFQNLMFSAIFSGGFKKNYYLEKMSIYLQLCYPNNFFQINQIYYLFYNQCLPILSQKANDFFKYIRFNHSNLPLFSKYFLISFIGYRNFPCGFPLVIKNFFMNYLSGSISFDNAVLILIKNGGNQIQKNAFLSFIRILFPSQKSDAYSDEDEFIFSGIFHLPVSENNKFIERIEIIIRNCIEYCNKKMQFNLDKFINDFLQFKNENIVNLIFESAQIGEHAFPQDCDNMMSENSSLNSQNDDNLHIDITRSYLQRAKIQASDKVSESLDEDEEEEESIETLISRCYSPEEEESMETLISRCYSLEEECNKQSLNDNYYSPDENNARSPNVNYYSPDENDGPSLNVNYCSPDENDARSPNDNYYSPDENDAQSPNVNFYSNEVNNVCSLIDNEIQSKKVLYKHAKI